MTKKELEKRISRCKEIIALNKLNGVTIVIPALQKYIRLLKR